ncbi:hypothetical protein EJ07DRAFT_98279 [Lizonia empirigonia]|nr:hypothetical protein EJ07DRAFT_98279 [Lizonia empirigonia]
MPRQLPWKSNGGGGSRTQTVKPPSRPPQANRNPPDIDDESFGGIVLAGSSSKGRGKGKAKVSSDSDNSLPNISAQQSTPRAKRTSGLIPKACAPSSSPPPEVDYALPQTEPMRKGVSKFDLRDDEWMMVEDEFLETAKLFTRHLRIAEYDKLKESIEAKKREAEVARPVVTGAKRSMEGTMKERARVQDSRQKKAIRDVFASRGDDDEDEGASYRQKPSRPTPNAAAAIVSKEVADRIAKRKVEREKASNGTNKKRATNLDDIPTFLF